ncbi:MAG: isoleucine--tRNA ligase [Candidatus Bathyarchaeia archaeon]
MQSFWDEIDAYDRRVEIQRQEEREPWSFIDGPITANNPMGVHHAWGRTYKDLWARYWFMRGREVRNQNGFDCQGLWVEVEVEKELGFDSKREIEEYGIANFVKKCKQRVLTYAAVQTEQSKRLGMWTEWDDPEELRKLAESLENPMEETVYEAPRGTVRDTAEAIVGSLGGPELGGSYFTLSDENNYMIWKALKSCHERGWIYRGMDSMPWCPRCSTGISQHEIVTEGYKELTHTSVYLRFPLRDRDGSLLIWTTTPWTLTSNVAVASHPELDYVKAERYGEVFYLSKGTLESVFPEGDYQVKRVLKGVEMEGWRYHGPYDELEQPRRQGAPEAHRVIMWEDVGEEEGTGLVHIAPGAGKEDLELGKKYGLPAIAPLDDYGVILNGFGWLSGTHVYESADPIFEDLEEKGLLLRTEDVTHRYPVCWRCGSELVFRYVGEWFIDMGEKLGKPLEEVTEEERERNLRYQIMESAKQTGWIPEFGLKRELDWLRNMDDWMISKKRYWGLALPIWTCKCGWFDVIGSREELEDRAIKGWEEFDGHSPHKPYIDEVNIRCERCGGVATRIPDVGNPWLDAGIVAFSTLQYRQNRDFWEKWFPADFITESFPGQFRNWFYSMLAMSTILERCTPYKTCLGHGMVLDERGEEMHKSWGNAIWFDDAAETMGSDVMRWIYCTTKPEADVLFGYNRANEVKRLFFMTLLNVYDFFVIYAKIDEWSPDWENVTYSTLDRWILSRLNMLIQEARKSLEEYDVYKVTQEISRFVDVLSKWYVRRSRRRFWKTEADDDKHAAYSTLYRCLRELTLVMAPIIPHLTEAIYQRMVRPAEEEPPESVHHNRYPQVDESMIDLELMEEMELAMGVSSLGRAARNRSGVKLRQPLREAVVVAPGEELDRLSKVSNLIKEELNVKELELTEDRSALVKPVANPIPRELGRKHGRLFPKVAEAIRNLPPEDARRLERGEGVSLSVTGDEITLLPHEVDVKEEPLPSYSVEEEGDIMVGMDTVITEELEIEGLARDIVRRVQDLRKQADFDIDGTIETYYSGDEELIRVFEIEGEYIKEETLSNSLHHGEPPSNAFEGSYEIDGLTLKLGLIRESKAQ